MVESGLKPSQQDTFQVSVLLTPALWFRAYCKWKRITKIHEKSNFSILSPLKPAIFSNSSAFAKWQCHFFSCPHSKTWAISDSFFDLHNPSISIPLISTWGKTSLPFVSFFLLSLNSPLSHCTLIQTPASFINQSPCLSIPSRNIYVGLPDLYGCVTSKLFNVMHFRSLSTHSRLFLLDSSLLPIFSFTNFWHNIGKRRGNTTYQTICVCHIFFQESYIYSCPSVPMED